MERVAVAAARTVALLLRGLGLGGGTAFPGLVALSICPKLVERRGRRLGLGCALVTGTNGKSTTARLLSGAVAACGLPVVANRAGSNLMRGVATALALSPHVPRSMGVFEVDEATLPEAIAALSPRAVVFTNLFRDQLDRYGEVDRVVAIWQQAVSSLTPDATIVLNADDPLVASLAPYARGPVLLYGLEDAGPARSSLEHAADARLCPRCGHDLEYERVYYAHLGWWRCPTCGLARRHPQVAATKVAQEGGLVLKMSLPDGRCEEVVTPLQGLYSAYNVLAATAATLALGLPWHEARRGLASHGPFGRQEEIAVRGRRVRVVLAKNPAGLNQVLRTLADAAPLYLAIFLNDRLADGRDVSWIWDVDFELLQGRVAYLLAGGDRAYDLALRLKYASLQPQDVERRPKPALERALAATPQGGILHVVPTYTALLEVREILARWAGRPHFWEG